MQKLSLDDVRKKYLTLVDRIGLDKSISALHAEISKLESHVFDGGYEEKRLEELTSYRAIARELFTYKINKDTEAFLKQNK